MSLVCEDWLGLEYPSGSFETGGGSPDFASPPCAFGLATSLPFASGALGAAVASHDGALCARKRRRDPGGQGKVARRYMRAKPMYLEQIRNPKPQPRTFNA